MTVGSEAIVDRVVDLEATQRQRSGLDLRADSAKLPATNVRRKSLVRTVLAAFPTMSVGNGSRILTFFGRVIEAFGRHHDAYL